MDESFQRKLMEYRFQLEAKQRTVDAKDEAASSGAKNVKVVQAAPVLPIMEKYSAVDALHRVASNSSQKEAQPEYEGNTVESILQTELDEPIGESRTVQANPASDYTYTTARSNLMAKKDFRPPKTKPHPQTANKSGHSSGGPDFADDTAKHQTRTRPLPSREETQGGKEAREGKAIAYSAKDAAYYQRQLEDVQVLLDSKKPLLGREQTQEGMEAREEEAVISAEDMVGSQRQLEPLETNLSELEQSAVEGEGPLVENAELTMDMGSIAADVSSQADLPEVEQPVAETKPLLVSDKMKDTMKPLPVRGEPEEEKAGMISTDDAVDPQRQLADVQALLDSKLEGSYESSLLRSSLIVQGFEIVQKALEADNVGEYEEALALYRDALTRFNKALKYERNVDRKKLVLDCVEGYMTRAEELADCVKRQRPTSPPESPKSGSQMEEGINSRWYL
jgi:hypothetical protein